MNTVLTCMIDREIIPKPSIVPPVPRMIKVTEIRICSSVNDNVANIEHGRLFDRDTNICNGPAFNGDVPGRKRGM